jgi:hypothetical protein
MRYAEYRAKKHFVGSGVVEAGGRTVVGERLKQSGLRWSVRGANAIMALRCCILSGRFEDFWASRAAQPPLLSRPPGRVVKCRTQLGRSMPMAESSRSARQSLGLQARRLSSVS